MSRRLAVAIVIGVFSVFSESAGAGMLTSLIGAPANDPGPSGNVHAPVSSGNSDVLAMTNAGMGSSPQQLPADSSAALVVSTGIDISSIHSSLLVTGHPTSMLAVQGTIETSFVSGPVTRGLGGGGAGGLGGASAGGIGGLSPVTTNALVASPVPTASLASTVGSATIQATVFDEPPHGPAGTVTAQAVLTDLIIDHPTVPGLPIALERVSQLDVPGPGNPGPFIGAPEPATFIIFAWGFAALCLLRRRGALWPSV